MKSENGRSDWTHPEEPGVYLFDLILIAWDRRIWIAGGTLLMALCGLAYGILAQPEYYAEAVISPKESRKGGGVPAMFTQMGGLGGILAAEMGMNGVTLGRLELVAKSRELTEEVVSGYGLLPVLFDEAWDPEAKDWRRGEAIPTARKGVDLLRKGILRVVADPKQGTLRIGIAFKDSTWAKRMADHYLEALNAQIRNNVIAETRQNQEFLTGQLGLAMDPLIREKIQNLIALEIERSMLASTRSFDIIEKPVVPSIRTKPKRKLILIVSAMAGFLMSLAGVLAWRFAESLRARSAALRREAAGFAAAR